jgi:hypothetical protein
MNAHEVIEAIRKVADAYVPSYRKDYHIGMLESHLRIEIQTLEAARAYIKDLETQLIAKDSE